MKLIKHSFSKNGVRRWMDTDSGITQTEGVFKTPDVFKIMCVMMVLKGMSFSQIGTMVDKSHTTIIRWFKIFNKAFLNEKLIDENTYFERIEIDEMWHYLKKKLTNCGCSLL
jgi:hypothetical protein